jgi:uncharacterized protein (TIGR03086 family)
MENTPMKTAEFYRRAVDEFSSRLEAVKPDQWHQPTPCTEWDVQALVKHVASEQLWAPDLLAGKTIAEIGDKYEGDILHDNPGEAWQQGITKALGAVNGQTDWQQAVHLSYADRSAKEYILELAADTLIHTWDLARAIGASEQLDGEMMHLAVQCFEPGLTAARESGIIGAEIKVAPDTDEQAKLLAKLGRQV